MTNKSLNLAPAKKRGRPPKASNYAQPEEYIEVPFTGLEPPSDHMTAEAKMLYEEMAQDLAIRGDVSKLDRYLIEAYCDQIVKYRHAMATISRTSAIIKNRNENLVQSPLNGVAQAALQSMCGLAVQLRMTPKSRFVGEDKKAAEKSAGSSEDF